MMENEKLDLILSKLGQMEEKLDQINQRLERIENDNINISIKKDTLSNVSAATENQLDLRWLFDNIQEIDIEKELLALRTKTLEKELLQVKEWFSQSANS